MAFHERDQAVTIINNNISTAVQNAPFTTNTYNIQSWSKYAFQVVITSASALNVTAVIEATLNGTDWDVVPSSSQTFTTNGSFIWDYGGGSSVIAVRVNFTTFSAGSGKFQVYAFAKL